MKILLIEDDLNLRKYIKEYLEAYDYDVLLIEDFSNILGTVSRFNPDLILLDINLPIFDGFYFLKLIKKKYKIPVIILSARSEEGEQIRGIELGAEDYITKPFSIGVLLAKINAIFRRIDESGEETKRKETDLYLIDESMKLNYKGSLIELSKNEYRILKVFISNPNKIIKREDLLEALWDDISFVDDNTLTVNITRVKKKLNDLGINNSIKAKRGIGYVFNKVDM